MNASQESKIRVSELNARPEIRSAFPRSTVHFYDTTLRDGEQTGGGAGVFFCARMGEGRDIVNREQFYAVMSGEGTLDYELYLNTKSLLSCQSKFEDLCNRDELQFQLVHQIEELWMKLIAYTLLDIDEYLQRENTNRVLTLFRRVHAAQRLMIQQLALLETMSPKEYQEIRKRLGNGSGQESPGFRVLLKMYQQIGRAHV